MSRKYYRLPTGNITKSVDYYLRSWKSIGRKVEKQTGWKLGAFDPDLQFIKDGKFCVSLPLWAVKDLIKNR
jgi:hypothetical protein